MQVLDYGGWSCYFLNAFLFLYFKFMYPFCMLLIRHFWIFCISLSCSASLLHTPLLSCETELKALVQAWLGCLPVPHLPLCVCPSCLLLIPSLFACCFVCLFCVLPPRCTAPPPAPLFPARLAFVDSEICSSIGSTQIPGQPSSGLSRLLLLLLLFSAATTKEWLPWLERLS